MVRCIRGRFLAWRVRAIVWMPQEISNRFQIRLVTLVGGAVDLSGKLHYPTAQRSDACMIVDLLAGELDDLLVQCPDLGHLGADLVGLLADGRVGRDQLCLQLRWITTHGHLLMVSV